MIKYYVAKKILIVLIGIFIGVSLGYVFTPLFKSQSNNTILSPISFLPPKKQVIGFLPYWLLDKANKDYSKYITTLAYFGLTIDTDGKILKLVNEQEEEPGWYALRTGKIDKFFVDAKKNGVALSLLVFNANENSIGQLISNPILHAKNLVEEVIPIMKRYGFTDLNLDIESVKEASTEAQMHFTQFAREVKKGLVDNQAGTLTIDASPTFLIKKYLINPKDIANIADYVVLMTYDYHYPGSYVTGPIAPLSGASTESEFDTETAVKEALTIMSAKQIILGAPLYGYEWETIRDVPRSVVIPESGITASTQRIEDYLQSCASCSAQTDEIAKEQYLIYKDQKFDTFHQIFFPDKNATLEKTNFANKNRLGGIAVWALGYEDDTILDPLSDYKK